MFLFDKQDKIYMSAYTLEEFTTEDVRLIHNNSPDDLVNILIIKLI